MAEKSEEEWEKEWELLPSNTSFLEFGLEDVKDLISTEIDYMDYLREEHLLKLIQDQQENQRNKPAAELAESAKHASDEKTVSAKEFVAAKAEDPKQSLTEEISRGNELKDKRSTTDQEKENSADRPCCKRGLAAGIGMLCSAAAAAAAAAACAVMLGGGLQHQQRRRTETLRFQIYAEEKALKRLNQALVATARGQPPAMRTATISFGGYFDGL